MTVRSPARRRLLKGALAAGASLAALGIAPEFAWARRDLAVTFTHGVASGDPLQDRVIIWTRAVAQGAADFFLFWLVSENADMSRPVAGGLVNVSAGNDNCCKVDVTGLQPGRTYFYRFLYRDQASPIGQTVTLPAGSPDRARFAVFSCANFEKGFFNVYREAVNRAASFDVVIHLGDYIYEYGRGGYVTPALAAGLVSEPRIGLLAPQVEIVQLAQYRQRYQTYRTDPDLQELHRIKPWITVWDDHESTNDSWRGGAQNHQPATEGPWETRLQTFSKAYDEWLPIRTAANGNLLQIYRAFDYGDLVRIVMLDTRIEGRDEYATSDTQLFGFYLTARPDGTFPADVNPNGMPRRMISTTQEAWLAQQLQTSTQPWQLIGNQTLMHYQASPNFADTRILPPPVRDAILAGIAQVLGGQAALAGFNQAARAGLPLFDFVADSWAAYPTARTRILSMLAQMGRNPIVVTGDSHNAWAANLALPGPTGPVRAGVELATASVTSPGFEEALVGFPSDALAAVIVESNPGTGTRADRLVYSQVANRGFMLVDITRQRTRCDWILLDTVFTRTYTARVDRSLQVLPGSRQLTPVT